MTAFLIVALILFGLSALYNLVTLWNAPDYNSRQRKASIAGFVLNLSLVMWAIFLLLR